MNALHSRSRVGAFTFIELMLVVAIIGALAMILFPVFARARSKARQSVCISNLQQIGTALAMYARDHNDFFPPKHDNLVPLDSYLRDATIFRCPEDLPMRKVVLRDGQLRNGSYRYYGGLSLDGNRASSLPVMCDRQVFHYEATLNFLFVDGHAKVLGLGQNAVLGQPFNPLPWGAP